MPPVSVVRLTYPLGAYSGFSIALSAYPTAILANIVQVDSPGGPRVIASVPLGGAIDGAACGGLLTWRADGSNLSFHNGLGGTHTFEVTLLFG
jgi:hypothetical protein